MTQRSISPGLLAAIDFARSPLAVVGALLLLVIVVLAVAGHAIAPQNPYDLKGLDIDLWQHNTEMAVPMLLSSKG